MFSQRYNLKVNTECVRVYYFAYLVSLCEKQLMWVQNSAFSVLLSFIALTNQVVF